MRDKERTDFDASRIAENDLDLSKILEQGLPPSGCSLRGASASLTRPGSSLQPQPGGRACGTCSGVGGRPGNGSSGSSSVASTSPAMVARRRNFG